MTTPARICGLVGLLAANVLVLCVLLGAVDLCLPQVLPILIASKYFNVIMSWLDHSAESILVGQMLMLGLIVALGGSSLPVRLVVGSLGVGLVVVLINGNRMLVAPPETRYWVPLDEMAKYGGVVVVTSLLLRAVRPWRGWRLDWVDSPPRIASRQFGIIHLLGWTAAIAFPLGMLQTVFFHRRLGLVTEVLLLFAWSLPVAIPAFCWTIRQGKNRRKWLWISLGMSALFSLWPALLFGSIYIYSGRGALPPWWVLPLKSCESFSCFALTLLVLCGNVLWMEKLGLRIRKPIPSTPSA
jgi:hypothetical protein